MLLRNTPGDLVAQPFAGNYSDIFTDPLVSVEIHSQSGVVFLNNDFGGLLHSLCTYATLPK